MVVQEWSFIERCHLNICSIPKFESDHKYIAYFTQTRCIMAGAGFHKLPAISSLTSALKVLRIIPWV